MPSFRKVLHWEVDRPLGSLEPHTRSSWDKEMESENGILKRFGLWTPFKALSSSVFCELGAVRCSETPEDGVNLIFGAIITPSQRYCQGGNCSGIQRQWASSKINIQAGNIDRVKQKTEWKPNLKRSNLKALQYHLLAIKIQPFALHSFTQHSRGFVGCRQCKEQQ